MKPVAVMTVVIVMADFYHFKNASLSSLPMSS